MNFTAIDFETANYSRASACALGITVVRDYEIVESKAWLICPPKLYFRPDFIDIHGITPDDVRNKPKWNELWPEISKYISGQMLVAHNAPFDISVMKAMLDEYGISHPSYSHFCSCKLSRRVWPALSNHRLNTVSEHLSIALKHHDAYDDAAACAQIILHAGRRLNVSSVQELIAI